MSDLMQAAKAQGLAIPCQDGVMLGGHLWSSSSGTPVGCVIINPATGVLARYYHRYAAFLANHGFDVITYDYRGIGLSRPARLQGCGYRWRDWGEQDFDAVLRFAQQRREQVRHEQARTEKLPLCVVGHSIGGFLPGLSAHAAAIDRMLTVGAQYAYWRDYAGARRAHLFAKWHVVMPALTALYGYFPGKRLGWLEDLPAGVANEWSFRGVRMEASHPRAARADVLARFAAVTAPILAVGMSDDELGTVRALGRTLAYYNGTERLQVLLQPSDVHAREVGHFGLFHGRHAAGFWLDTLLWLRGGLNPWPERIVRP